MINKGLPKGILIDLEGTLLQKLEFNSKKGDKKILEYATNIKASTEDVIHEKSSSLFEYIVKKRDSTNLEFSAHNFQKLLHAQLSLKFSISAEDLELEFWKHSTKMKPLKDLEKALYRINNLGIKMGVLSNSAFSSDVLRWELESHGVGKYFAVVISSADYGVRKPEKIFFEIAIAQMGLPSSELLYIGNDYEIDYLGASNSLIPSVLFNPTIDISDKHIEHVFNWTEVVELLERIKSEE